MKQTDIGIIESFKLLFKAGRGFALINLVNFADGVAYFGILTLLTRFLGTRIGMSDHATSMSVSMFTGLVTLFMFGGGFVSDRLGVRRAIIWSLGLLGLGRFCLVIAPALGPGMAAKAMAFTGLILMAMGSGIIQPALYAGVKEYTDPRTATIGFSVIYAIMNLGIVAENFISPFIRTGDVFLNLRFTQIVGLGWGIDGVFWMCLAVTGLAFLATVTLFSKKVEEKERLSAAARTSERRSWKEAIRAFPLMDTRFLFFIFILLPVRTLFAHQFLTLPDYVFRAYPEAVSAKFEWINGLNPFIIVIFVPAIAAITRRVRVIDMMIIGTAISAVTGFLLTPGPNLGMLLSYVILFSFGEAIWSSRFLEYVATIAPAGKVGAYMGIAGIPWFLAKFTTGFYSGFMLQKFIPAHGPGHSGTLWLMYTMLALVSPIGLIIGRQWILKKNAEAEPVVA